MNDKATLRASVNALAIRQTVMNAIFAGCDPREETARASAKAYAEKIKKPVVIVPPMGVKPREKP